MINGQHKTNNNRPGSHLVSKKGQRKLASDANAGPASTINAQRHNSNEPIQEDLVQDQIEKAHAQSCEEIVRQNDNVVADL
jgi:hypothetical protein